MHCITQNIFNRLEKVQFSIGLVGWMVGCEVRQNQYLLKYDSLILILMKFVAGTFSVDATGRELGRKVIPNDGQLS